MSSYRTAALVGAAGGAGTTRTAIEVATTLAAGGDDVAVLDAAYATQGLGDYLEGALSPDLTALVTDRRDDSLDAGLVDLPVDIDAGDVASGGRVACCPTRAPFERLARAKTPGAARALETRIEEAAERFDHVLIDTPPLAANQAIAAATACERVALVAPATTRGADAACRMRERLADVGADDDLFVATRGSLDDATVSLPAVDRSAPACLDGGEFAAALVRLSELLFDRSVTPPASTGGFLSGVSDYVGR